VFHCDEESQVTVGLVGGIRDAVIEEELRAAEGKTPRIGQGTIVYWRSLRAHPILTLADSLRTGDDATRFRTQFRMGALFCGMHGSFILVRADIERTVSFDVGPEGSITEDAWWAFAQAFFGREFRWVDGYLVEQSPEHWKDFAKQRRRWYSGLWKVVLYSPAPVLARAALAGFLVTWIASAIGGIYTVINLFTGLVTPIVPSVMGGFVFAWYVSSYVTGLWLSLRSMPLDVLPSRPVRALLYVAQVVLLPVFGVLETLGVLYAVLAPERGFHVIKKSGEATGVAEALAAPQREGAPVPAVALDRV
jgi:egghead protein (zeste-white 4 protein)